MSRMISKPNARDIAPEKLAELKRNAAAILADTRMNFQRQQPFVASVSMSLNLIPTRDSRNPTAATDGMNLYFDIAFLSELSPNDRMFVLGHEVYHNVMLHFIRQGDRDRNLWNIAADMEVNNILREDGLVPPASAILPEKEGFAKDKSAEEYYELLVNRQQFKQMNNSGAAEDGDGNADGGSSSSSQPTQSGNAEGKLDGQFDKHIYDDEDMSSMPSPKDTADKYGKVGEDEDFAPHVEENAVEKIREAAVAAAQQIERTRGELPGHLQRLVKKLLEPEIDWKEILAQHLTRCMSNEATWNRPNRRFAYNSLYLPGHEGKMLKVAVGLDTSGSTVMDTEKFLTELNGIVGSCDQYSVDVIQCDTHVQHVDHYDNETPLNLSADGFEQHGGGGTRLKGIFDHIDLNDLDIDLAIVMTDGYCETFRAEDAPSYPVLWVLTGDAKADNLGFGDKVKFVRS